MDCSTNSAAARGSKWPDWFVGGLVVVATLTALGSGCREQSETVVGPADPFGELANASGERIVVETLEEDEATPVAKFRWRRNELEVYDRRFAAVGTVRRSSSGPGERDGGMGTERSTLRIVRYAGPDEVTLERVQRGVWEIGQRVRLERTGRGWAVFDPEAEWLGRFEIAPDGNWRLTVGEEAESVWTVRREGNHWVARRANAGAAVRARAAEYPETLLLSLQLEELDLVDRAALGMWLADRDAPNDDVRGADTGTGSAD